MRAALVLVMALAACSPRDAREAREVARGEAIAAERCAACHATGRTGASPRANAPAFRDLHRRYPVEQLAEALAEGIVTGHPDMPEVAFDQADTNALIAYLRSLER